MVNPHGAVPAPASDWAQQLAEAVPQILRAWEARVRSELPIASAQDSPALRNHLPVFLLQLAHSLSADDPEAVTHLPDAVRRGLGPVRTLAAGQALGQVVREYAILREVILEAVPPADQVPAATRLRFHQAIDAAIAEAVSEFATETRRELDRSEERYRLLVEGVQDYALFLLDSQGRFESWNPGAERLTGFSAADVVGQHFSLLFTQEDRDSHQPEQELATARGQRRAADTRWHRRKDSSLFWANGETRALWTEAGTLRGYVKVMTDQTPRKLAEAERDRLLLAERQSREEAEATVDRLRRLQTVADAALRHQDQDELLGALLDAIQVALEADTCAILLREGSELRVRAARGLEQGAEEIRVPLGGGFVGRVAAGLRPLVTDPSEDDDIVSPVLRESGLRSLLGIPLLADGELVGVVHVGSRSPREFGNEEVRLLELVALRSALAIRNAELMRRLEEADRRKNEFLAMLAHEMRTPLSAITNALFILENVEIPDERAVRQLITATRQTQQLSRLTEDLLDVARVTSGKVELSLAPLDLRDVVQNAADGIAPLVEARGQQQRCTVPEEPVCVAGDALRLEQVVTNLLSNAAKYTDPGGEVDVRLEIEPTPPCAVLRVRDTGRGIEPILLPQIFDLFMQADPSGVRSRGGLGIGLTLVRRLVERHGGTIEVYSAGTGKGSEFVVRLPLLSGPDGPK